MNTTYLRRFPFTFLHSSALALPMMTSLVIVNCGGTRSSLGAIESDSGAGGAGAANSPTSNAGSPAGGGGPGTPTGGGGNGGASGGAGATEIPCNPQDFQTEAEMQACRKTKFGSAMCNTIGLPEKFRKCNECICRECNDFSGQQAGTNLFGPLPRGGVAGDPPIWKSQHAVYYATQCFQDKICTDILTCAQVTRCGATTCINQRDDPNGAGCGDIILKHVAEAGPAISWAIGTDCLDKMEKCKQECRPDLDGGR